MDENLQSLLDLAGVNAAMVLDDAGRLVGQRGKAIYDRPLCEQVGVMLARAVDSIALQHPDWESASVQYADGTILLRNVGAVLGASYVLAVAADATLNSAFAAVALRVVANKAKRAIELGQGLTPSATGSTVLGSSVGTLPMASGSQVQAAPAHPGSGSRPVLATSGVSWSQAGGSGVSAEIVTADAASSAYLSRSVKTLARHVGPMAKLYVNEAVRRICQDAPFSMALARNLIEELAAHIEEAPERTAFLKAMDSTGATSAAPAETATTFANRSVVLFRPTVYHKEILPAYQAFAGSREKILLRELLERARPLAAKARSGLGPNLIIQSELDDALKKLKSEATPFGDLDRLTKGPWVTGLVDLLCVPWERKETPVQPTWGCPLSEYLEPQSPWIAGHLLRGVPQGTEMKLPSGAPIRLCAPAEVDRLRKELALVARPADPDPAQREYDTLRVMVETLVRSPDLSLALWSR
jgi:hypothetical protein